MHTCEFMQFTSWCKHCCLALRYMFCLRSTRLPRGEPEMFCNGSDTRGWNWGWLIKTFRVNGAFPRSMFYVYYIIVKYYFFKNSLIFFSALLFILNLNDTNYNIMPYTGGCSACEEFISSSTILHLHYVIQPCLQTSYCQLVMQHSSIPGKYFSGSKK